MTSPKLRLPKHMIFHHDLHLIVFRPKGVLTKERIDKDIQLLEAAEDRQEQPFNRFTDLSQVTQIKLNFQEVFRISLHRRLRYVDKLPVKSAFLVTTDEAARVVRTHAFLTDYSPIHVQMFDDLSAASEWLGVALDDLQMGS